MADTLSSTTRRLLDLLIRRQPAVGDRITEQSIADELGLSRSPVRKALQALEAMGVVGSEPNRGFFVAVDIPALRTLELPDDDGSDEAVYMRVVEDRLTRRLESEVAESTLMERYELTRLQVQRVLNRMAREHLIDRKPGRGWVFRPVLDSAASHRDSYRFRMIIEPAALLEPGFRADRAAFTRVRRQQQDLIDGGIERWTAAERFRAGADFHEALVECSGNTFLIDALRRVNELRRVIEYHSQTGSAKDRTRMRRQCQEHLLLLDLIESGNRNEAAHKLRQHLDVVSAIKTESERPAEGGAWAETTAERDALVHL